MSKTTKELIEIVEDFDPQNVVDTTIGGLGAADTKVNGKNTAYYVADYDQYGQISATNIKGSYVDLAGTGKVYYALGMSNVYGFYYNPNITGTAAYSVYAGLVDNKGQAGKSMTFARKAAASTVYATGANVNFVDTTASMIYAGANNPYTVSYVYDGTQFNAVETSIVTTVGENVEAYDNNGNAVAWSNTINLINTTVSVIYAGGNGDDVMKSDVYVNLSNSNASAIYAGGTLGAYSLGDLIVTVSNSGNADAWGINNAFYGMVYGHAADTLSDSWGSTYVNVKDYNGIYYGGFSYVEKVTVSGNSNVNFYGYFNEVNTISVVGNAHATVYGGAVYEYELYLDSDSVGGTNAMLSIENYYMNPANITVVVDDSFGVYNDVNLIEWIGYHPYYQLEPTVTVKNADGGYVADYKYNLTVDANYNLGFEFTDEAYVMEVEEVGGYMNEVTGAYVPGAIVNVEDQKTFGIADDDVVLANGYNVNGAVIDLGAGSNSLNLGANAGAFELTVKKASENKINAFNFAGTVFVKDFKGVSDNTVIVGAGVTNVYFGNTKNAKVVVGAAVNTAIDFTGVETAEIELLNGSAINYANIQAGKAAVKVSVNAYAEADLNGFNIADYVKGDAAYDKVVLNIGTNAALNVGADKIVSTYNKNLLVNTNVKYYEIGGNFGAAVLVDGAQFTLENYGTVDAVINAVNTAANGFNNRNNASVDITNYASFNGTVNMGEQDGNDTITSVNLETVGADVVLGGTLNLGGGVDNINIVGDQTVAADISKYEGSTLNINVNNGTVDYEGAVNFTKNSDNDIDRVAAAEKNAVVNLNVSDATLNFADNGDRYFDTVTLGNASVNGKFDFANMNLNGDVTFDSDEEFTGNVNVLAGNVLDAQNLTAANINVAGALNSKDLTANGTLTVTGDVDADAVKADVANIGGTVDAASIEVAGALTVTGNADVKVAGAVTAASINEAMVAPYGNVEAASVKATAGNINLNKVATTGNVEATGSVAIVEAAVAGAVVAGGNVGINGGSAASVAGADVTFGDVAVAGAVAAAGTLNVNGTVTAGAVTAATANVAGALTAADVAADNAVVSGTLNSADLAVAETLTVTGTVDAADVTAGAANIGGTVNADSVEVTGALTVTGVGAIVTEGDVKAASINQEMVAPFGDITAKNIEATDGNITLDKVVASGNVTATGSVAIVEAAVEGNVVAGGNVGINGGSVGNVEGADVYLHNVNAKDVTANGDVTLVATEGYAVKAGAVTANGVWGDYDDDPETPDTMLKGNVTIQGAGSVTVDSVAADGAFATNAAETTIKGAFNAGSMALNGQVVNFESGATVGDVVAEGTSTVTAGTDAVQGTLNFGTLAVGATANADVTLDLNGGTVTVDNDADDDTITDADTTVANGSTLTIANGSFVGGIKEVGTGATVVLDNATVDSIAFDGSVITAKGEGNKVDVVTFDDDLTVQGSEAGKLEIGSIASENAAAAVTLKNVAVTGNIDNADDDVEFLKVNTIGNVSAGNVKATLIEVSGEGVEVRDENDIFVGWADSTVEFANVNGTIALGAGKDTVENIKVTGVADSVMVNVGAGNVEFGSWGDNVDEASINAKDVVIKAQATDIVGAITAAGNVTITEAEGAEVVVSGAISGKDVTVKDAVVAGNITASGNIDVTLTDDYTGKIVVNGKDVVVNLGNGKVDNLDIQVAGDGSFSFAEGTTLGSQVNADLTASNRELAGTVTYAGDYVGNITGTADVTIGGYLFGAYDSEAALGERFTAANVAVNSLTVNGTAGAGLLDDKFFEGLALPVDPEKAAMVEVTDIITEKYQGGRFTYANVTAEDAVTIKNIFVGTINAKGDVTLTDYEKAFAAVKPVTPAAAPNGFYDEAIAPEAIAPAVYDIVAGDLTADNVSGKTVYYVNNEYIDSEAGFPIRKYVVVTSGANVKADDVTINGNFFGNLTATGDVVMAGTVAQGMKETFGTESSPYNGDVEYTTAEIVAGTFKDATADQIIKANITANGSAGGNVIELNSKVEGNLTATNGAIKAADVKGDISAENGLVNAEDVTGNITAIDVIINSVEGDVKATGKVIAGNVDGNVLSAAAVKVAEDVTGNITAGDVNVGNNVGGTIAATGNVDVKGNVAGNVVANGNGNVTVGTVGTEDDVETIENEFVASDIVAVGNVTAKVVTGNVEGANVTVDKVYGNVTATGDVKVDSAADISGVNVTAGSANSIEASGNVTAQDVVDYIDAVGNVIVGTEDADGSVGTDITGADVTVYGTVGGDVIAADAAIYGTVGGSVAATGNVLVTGTVGGGASVESTNGNNSIEFQDKVTGDVTFVAKGENNAATFADIEGDVTVEAAADIVTDHYAAEATLNAGTIDGNVTLNGFDDVVEVGEADLDVLSTITVNATAINGAVQLAYGNFIINSAINGSINGTDVSDVKVKGDVTLNAASTVDSAIAITGNVYGAQNLTAETVAITGEAVANITANGDVTVGGDFTGAIDADGAVVINGANVTLNGACFAASFAFGNEDTTTLTLNASPTIVTADPVTVAGNLVLEGYRLQVEGGMTVAGDITNNAAYKALANITMTKDSANVSGNGFTEIIIGNADGALVLGDITVATIFTGADDVENTLTVNGNVVFGALNSIEAIVGADGEQTVIFTEANTVVESITGVENIVLGADITLNSFEGIKFIDLNGFTLTFAEENVVFEDITVVNGTLNAVNFVATGDFTGAVNAATVEFGANVNLKGENPITAETVVFTAAETVIDVVAPKQTITAESVVVDGNLELTGDGKLRVQNGENAVIAVEVAGTAVANNTAQRAQAALVLTSADMVTVSGNAGFTAYTVGAATTFEIAGTTNDTVNGTADANSVTLTDSAVVGDILLGEGDDVLTLAGTYGTVDLGAGYDTVNFAGALEITSAWNVEMIAGTTDADTLILGSDLADVELDGIENVVFGANTFKGDWTLGAASELTFDGFNADQTVAEGIVIEDGFAGKAIVGGAEWAWNADANCFTEADLTVAGTHDVLEYEDNKLTWKQVTIA